MPILTSISGSIGGGADTMAPPPMTPQRSPVSFIATSQPDVAEAFYSTVLGLDLRDASPYALVYDDGGQMLRVQIVADFVPPSYTVHGWQVQSLRDEVSNLSAKGVSVIRYDGLAQDEHGIWTTPDGHMIAWFHDPSGNILSLTQYRPPA